MDVTTGMHEGRDAPASRGQLLKNLNFARQMLVTKADIKVKVREACVEKAVKRETILPVLAMQHIIK